MLEDLSIEDKRALFRAITVCVAIFFADASHSLVIPIFPAYAQGLGASLTLIGLYGSAVGVAMALLSLPIGSMSDRFGRKGVLLLGFTLMVIVPLMYIFATSPMHLLFARLLLGVSMGSTFGLGFVWVSELAPDKTRSFAQGLYMTAMGIGFTVGPIIGGYASVAWGLNSAFMASSILGVGGLITLLLIRSEPQKHPQQIVKTNLLETLTNPKVLAAGISNFINSLIFGALSTFFPLYGALIGFNSANIGLGFTVRGLFSTAIRFPAGAASRGGKVFWLLLGSLAAQAVLIALITFTTRLDHVLVILAVQGLMYGIYLTSGNIYVTTESPPEHRGAAMGVYQIFSTASSVVSPIILGYLAELYGIATAIHVAAEASIFGILFIILLSRIGYNLSKKIL